MSGLILAFIIVALIGYILSTKTRLSSQVNSIVDIEQQIDAKLEQRYKVFSQLIEVMGKYMNIETTTFREVAELHEAGKKARRENDERSFVGDEDEISRHAEGVSYAFEQHLDLKADEEAQTLHKQLLTEEDELAQLKLQCNTHIEKYNNTKHSLFGSMVAMLFSSQFKQDFELWHVNSDALGGRDDYKVEL